MPKKPNADIRTDLLNLALDMDAQADLLRAQADDIETLAQSLRDEASELHNAPVKKPRAKAVPSGITRAVVISVKARAFAGEASSDIAAHYGFNQGRVNDILNGKYDHAR